MSSLRVALVASDLHPMPEWVPQQLAEAGIEFIERLCDEPNQVPAAAGEADVVWLMGGSKVVTADVLNQLPRCRVLLRTGTGTDNVPVDEATKLGIYVANTPQAVGHTVAEHALGLLLAVTRQIVAQDRLVRQGVWDRARAWPNWSFQGRTLGLVGFGRIAQLLAAKARGLELRFISADPIVNEDAMRDHGVTKVSLDELLQQSDYISLHVPLLPATRHLIGDKQLRMMKRHAILINTARGPIIDEQALVQALREGWIGGAGLDVCEVEPAPADHPLLQFANVVLTPHIAGYSDEFHHNFWSHSVQTLKAVATESRPLWVVNATVSPRPVV